MRNDINFNKHLTSSPLGDGGKIATILKTPFPIFNPFKK